MSPYSLILDAPTTSLREAMPHDSRYSSSSAHH
jgi:hypothetical protein